MGTFGAQGPSPSPSLPPPVPPPGAAHLVPTRGRHPALRRQLVPWVRAHPGDLFQFPQSHGVRARLMLQGPPSRKRIPPQEGQAVGARGREPPSLSCPEPPNRCYLLTDHAHGHGRGHRPLLQTLPAPQEAPKGLPCVGAMLRGPAGPPSPFLRLAWPALGWGGTPQSPLFVLRMTFLLRPPTPLLSPPGARWAARTWHHIRERSASSLTCTAWLSSDPCLPCKGNS